MAEELRLVYTEAFLLKLAGLIKVHFSDFPEREFYHDIVAGDWPDLALKARMSRITQMLFRHLPNDFHESLDILKPVSTHFSGFEAMFFPEFVALHGLDDWEASIPALAHFTRYSSSEFAVRPFIRQDSKRMMQQMLDWSHHENEHVRRLSSEGCRSRLPWAMALPEFKQDPAPIMQILLNLLQDESMYVRKSVANNLNDIAKDHPDIVINLVAEKLGQHAHTDWILKHASRTLLKQAEPRILALFSLGEVTHLSPVKVTISKPDVAIGDAFNFTFTLSTANESLGNLRVEYAVHFVKSNGKVSRKVFKIGEGEVKDNEKVYLKTHSLKQLTTRKHYPGEHKLEVLVNGQSVAECIFNVTEH